MMMFSNMSSWGRPLRFVISILALSGLGVIAVAQEDPSGVREGSARGASVFERAAAELDDAFVSTEIGRYPAPDLVDLRDTAQRKEPVEPTLALWEQLASLDEAQRANANIEIELGSAADDADRDAAAKIAKLWNRGDHAIALAELRTLEKAGVPLAASIAWIEPIAFGGSRMNDVRIGTRTEAQAMNLDFDASSGNVFAVVRWGSTTGTSAWTMNISSDGGVTWSESYYYPSSVGVIDVDCAVVDDYVYVAYVAGNATNEARIRRCLTSTGANDSDYGFHTVFHAGADTVEEVALASNAEDMDNRIYYAAIQSDDVLRWAYDVGNDGTTFVENSPAGANPEYGLDMTWDNNRSACAEFIYVSYAGVDGDIHVLGHGETSWTDWAVETSTGSFRTTAISAYESTIICAFEYPYIDGTGIRYRISYDCGETWTPGSLAVPDGVTIFGYFEPDVDARDGHGTAIIYQAEAGELDPMYYRTRAGYVPGAWSDPALFSDHDVYTGSDTAIGHLSPLGGESFSHGALYLSLDPDFRTPYFDRPQVSGVACNDATPPTVSINEPTALGCACDMVNIRGSVDDPDGTYTGDRLEIRRRGTTGWTVVDTASGARSGVLYTWDTSGLAQDYYCVRIVGENECGLSSSDVTFVYVSSTFNDIELRSPEYGGVYGGSVSCDGTAATEPCFAAYTVNYRPTGGTWLPVDPSHPVYMSTVINDPLALWNTVSLALSDGDYDLRLMGETVCGDTASTVISVTLDNTLPIARLDAPENCVIHASETSIEIRGEASDANLAEWTLAVIGGPYDNWHTLVSPITSSASGVLFTWDTSGLPDCAYTVRLRATDNAVLGTDESGHVVEDYASILLGDWSSADLDGDGDVDLGDFQLFQQQFTGPLSF